MIILVYQTFVYSSSFVNVYSRSPQTGGGQEVCVRGVWGGGGRCSGGQTRRVI